MSITPKSSGWSMGSIYVVAAIPASPSFNFAESHITTHPNTRVSGKVQRNRHVCESPICLHDR
jgi:hypothetical protein